MAVFRMKTISRVAGVRSGSGIGGWGGSLVVHGVEDGDTLRSGASPGGWYLWTSFRVGMGGCDGLCVPKSSGVRISMAVLSAGIIVTLGSGAGSGGCCYWTGLVHIDCAGVVGGGGFRLVIRSVAGIAMDALMMRSYCQRTVVFGCCAEEVRWRMGAAGRAAGVGWVFVLATGDVVLCNMYFFI